MIKMIPTAFKSYNNDIHQSHNRSKIQITNNQKLSGSQSIITQKHIHPSAWSVWVSVEGATTTTGCSCRRLAATESEANLPGSKPCVLPCWEMSTVGISFINLSSYMKTHINKKCTQRAQTSADPEDPDFGLWTPGSEAWSGSPPKLYHLVLEPS